jgi:hypothetical protein
MGANQNFSLELGIYPKPDPTHLSSNTAKTHLSYNIAIKKLSALGIGLGTAAEIRIDTSENTCQTDDEKW